ncbi:tripartite tricarboxylate transporter substrate binding protein [Pusillimonas sp. SM2304]|uniref:Bug family tripartite tricarboxylate transporter substrate binding protein n=1 Tax=Pusillimonas sp. SM2304 TaxID=3073241 RepID=UPI00287424BF|nr:tripartite tricarboxylate transporter substrate binding protein [Pusillimonas sp. SM2304]MDS1139063.1 tripartite tricarboxylate transporter substrate binding protein [Pusillimonas sp. SM2304]
MQKKSRANFLKILLAGTACSLTALAASPAMAAYPDKPIVIVVPFSPGGSTDQIGRMIAQHFTNEFNVPVVVENKPGASGTVGNSYVARAKPDGYTLLIGGTDITASQFLYKDLPYDPEQAFTPIGIVSEFPFLMLVDIKRNITTVQEFVDYAKKNPDKITFSSAGMGNSTHLAGETFKQAAQLDGMVHVPYNGSSQALTAVISGQVDTVFDTAITAAPLVTGGKANALGVVAQKRLPLLPDVPTMSELGYKEFDQLAPWSWKGLFAPSDTPQDILDKLQKSLAGLLEDPEFQKRIEASASLVVAPQSTTSAKQFLTDQRKGWSKLISDANVQPM